MATTGRLGSLNSQLGNVQLGVDNEGHPLGPVASLGHTPTADLAPVASLGALQARTVTAALALSRPPSREAPAFLAAYTQPQHEVPAALAAKIRVYRTVPVGLALYTTAARLVLTAVAIEVPPNPALQAPRRQSLMPPLLEAFTPLYDQEPGAVPMLTVQALPDTPAMPWRITGSLFELTALPEVAPVAGGAPPPARDRRERTDAIYQGVPAQDAVSPAQGDVTPATGLAPFTRDLRRLTLGQLAEALSLAGYPATADPTYADLTGTTLCDGAGDILAEGDLGGYTTLLWRILRALALGGELLLDDIDAAIRQLDLRFAEGRWLDWWGALYAAPREPLEPDADYRKRIVWSVIRPRTNNAAIDAILGEVTGLATHTTDDLPSGVARADHLTPEPIDRAFAATQATPGTYFPGYPPRFTVGVPPDTPIERQQAVGRLVGQLKAAGVRYRVLPYAEVAHDLALFGAVDEANATRAVRPVANLWPDPARAMAPQAALGDVKLVDLAPAASLGP